MVMFTSAAGTEKSAAILGMAVVRTVPSRNSIKNVAATRRASRGLQLPSAGAARGGEGFVPMGPRSGSRMAEPLFGFQDSHGGVLPTDRTDGATAAGAGTAQQDLRIICRHAPAAGRRVQRFAVFDEGPVE